jgi:hypothetical protein
MPSLDESASTTAISVHSSPSSVSARLSGNAFQAIIRLAVHHGPVENGLSCRGELRRALRTPLSEGGFAFGL